MDRKLNPFDVATAFYNLPPGKRHYKELVQVFKLPRQNLEQSKASENKLSKMVREFEADGFIHHTVLRENEEFLPRKTALEDQLRYHFKLRQAIVVDISSLDL